MYCNFVVSTTVLTLHIGQISLIRIEKNSFSLLRKNNKVKLLYPSKETSRFYSIFKSK